MTSDRDLDQARWRKSSYSGASGGSCLEICEDVSGVVPVRDSKSPNGPILTLTPTAFAGLVDLARHMNNGQDLSQARWSKSSYSGNGGSACVEWAPSYASTHGIVPVRDSKNPDGPVLALTPTAFAGLINLARHADV